MISCIYFLFRRNKLLYIGQTANFEDRIKSYCRRVYITKIRIIRCDPSKLREYESRLIRFFKPPCNKQHNPNMKFRSADHSVYKRTKRIFNREIIGYKEKALS